MFGESKIKKLEVKSKDATGVFKKMLVTLEQVNQEAAVELARKQEEISVLQQEVQDLKALQKENNETIEKVQVLIN